MAHFEKNNLTKKIYSPWEFLFLLKRENNCHLIWATRQTVWSRRSFSDRDGSSSFSFIINFTYKTVRPIDNYFDGQQCDRCCNKK